MPAFSVWSELVALNSEAVDPEWEGCNRLLHQNSVRWSQRLPVGGRLDGVTRQNLRDGSGTDNERSLDGVTRQSRRDGSEANPERSLDGVTRQNLRDGSERRLDGVTRQSWRDGSEAPPLLKVTEFPSPSTPTAGPSFLGHPTIHNRTDAHRATFIKPPQLPDSLQSPPPPLTSSTLTPLREMDDPWLTIIIHRENSHALITGWKKARSELPRAPRDVWLRRHQPLPVPVSVEIPTDLSDELWTLWTHKKKTKTSFDDLFDLWIT